MIKEEDLKYKNYLSYYEGKLFTGQSINIYQNKYWYKEGKLHRDNDLPAIEYSNGNKYWYKEGKRHRDNDLPALECNNGSKWWYKEGKYHREIGPAIELNNGDKYWFYNDERIYCKNNDEFLKIIKFFIFK